LDIAIAVTLLVEVGFRKAVTGTDLLLLKETADETRMEKALD
jgi:hypothetical protein